jgi:transcription initiation factor TFIID subunit 5
MAGKPRENGSMTNGDSTSARVHEEGENNETPDLVSTFPTKRTPIINVQFTPVNHCLVAGTYQAPESR